MNILEISVLIIIGICVIAGYRKGFLRVLYSLFAWVLLLALVTWSSPYLAKYLEENTTLKASLKEKTITYIKEKAEQKIEDETQKYSGEQQENIEAAGIWLPEGFADMVMDSVNHTANDVLDSAGIYEEIADAVAHYLIKGISFFISLIIAGILASLLTGIIDVVAHLPFVNETNKMLGAGIGAVKGVLIVWLVFYVITLSSTSEWGAGLLIYIKESTALKFLYENNILLNILMIFL